MAMRINRCVELLGLDQAIYYDGPHSGHVLTHAQGRIDAATWADYMNVGMEHGAFDMAGLAEYMRGMVEPGRRAPDTARRRSSSRRRSTASTPRMCATTPGSSARSSAAARMAFCCARPRPPTRCAPSSNPAAIRTMRSGSIPRCPRPLARMQGAIRPRTAAPTPPASCSASAPAAAARKPPPHRSGAFRPKTTCERCEPWPLNPNGEFCSGVKLESPEGVANCEEILAVPGLGFAEIGPGDLSLSLGYRTIPLRALSCGDAGRARPHPGRLPQERRRVPAGLQRAKHRRADRRGRAGGGGA